MNGGERERERRGWRGKSDGATTRLGRERGRDRGWDGRGGRERQKRRVEEAAENAAGGNIHMYR